MSECDTIKAALTEIEKRLDDDPSPEERLALEHAHDDLQWRWRQQCSEGTDWQGSGIDPPTEDAVRDLSEKLNSATGLTVANIQSDDFVDVMNTVLGQV